MPRILLVEDHSDTANAFSRLLDMTRYQVRVAPGIQSALTLATQEQFDLLVCDIGLPDGSGLELMRVLSSQYKMPGVAVSGFGMPQDIAACQAAGFCEHVLKPATFEKLATAIEKCLKPRTAMGA